VRATGTDQLEIRTYERGVEDETLACGTGAIACALVGSIRGMVSSPVKVKTKGGEDLKIHFRRKGDSFDEVWLQGNTSIVYQGQLHAEAL
jgi:diaminopimelate epimerase